MTEGARAPTRTCTGQYSFSQCSTVLATVEAELELVRRSWSLAKDNLSYIVLSTVQFKANNTKATMTSPELFNEETVSLDESL